MATLWPDPSQIIGKPSGKATPAGLSTQPKTATSGQLWPDAATIIGTPSKPPVAAAGIPGVTPANPPAVKIGLPVPPKPAVVLPTSLDKPLGSNGLPPLNSVIPIQPTNNGASTPPSLANPKTGPLVFSVKGLPANPPTVADPTALFPSQTATIKQKQQELADLNTSLTSSKPNPKTATQKQVDTFNSKVDDYNAKLKDYNDYITSVTPNIQPVDNSQSTFKGPSVSQDISKNPLDLNPITQAKNVVQHVARTAAALAISGYQMFQDQAENQANLQNRLEGKPEIPHTELNKSVEPASMSPLMQKLLGTDTIKTLPGQASDLETQLNNEGIKGNTAAILASLGVSLDTVATLYPFVAGGAGAAANDAVDSLANNFTKDTGIDITRNDMYEISRGDPENVVRPEVKEAWSNYVNKAAAAKMAAASGGVTTIPSGENPETLLSSVLRKISSKDIFGGADYVPNKPVFQPPVNSTATEVPPAQAMLPGNTEAPVKVNNYQAGDTNLAPAAAQPKGESALTLKDLSGQKFYVKLSPAEQSVLYNEVGNIPQTTQGMQVHLDPLNDKLTQGATEVSKQEFAKLSSEAGQTVANMESGGAYNAGQQIAKGHLDSGNAVVLDPDQLKEVTGNNTTENHSVYSAAVNKLYNEFLPQVENPLVKFTAGGPGSGKTDFVTDLIKKDFNGIVVDGTLANYDSFISKVNQAALHGKNSQINLVLPDIEKAWKYAQLREQRTGRGISLDGFLERHIGAVNTVIKVLKNNPDVVVKIKDLRNVTSKEQAINSPFITDHKQILDTLQNVAYNEEELRKKLYGNSKTNRRGEQELGKSPTEISGGNGRGKPEIGTGRTGTGTAEENVNLPEGRGIHKGLNRTFINKSSAEKYVGGLKKSGIEATIEKKAVGKKAFVYEVIEQEPIKLQPTEKKISTFEQAKIKVKSESQIDNALPGTNPQSIGTSRAQLRANKNAATMVGRAAFGDLPEEDKAKLSANLDKFLNKQKNSGNLGFTPIDSQKATSVQQIKALEDAKIGTGDYKPGEIYIQKIKDVQRPVQITKVNADGSLNGWYVGSPGAEGKIFGSASLTPGQWEKSELEIPDFTQQRFNEMVEKVFNKPEAAAKKPPTLKKPAASSGDLGFNPKNLDDLDKPAAIKETDKIIKRSEIAKQLSEKLDVPIRRGKFRAKGALGVFKSGPKVVRIKSGSLNTVFHEIGHFIDDKFDFSKDLNVQERQALMEEYGNKYENQPKKQEKEGFAEFIRFSMTGQEARAEELAPKFAKIFEKRMAELPEIKDVLDAATADYKRWQEQPAVAKVLSHISFGEENKPSFKTRMTTNWHVFYTNFFDDLHPLSEFTDLAKKQGISVAAENDPYILARNLRGWTGKAETFLDKGTFGRNYWKVEDGKTVPVFTGKGLTEILEPVIKTKALSDFSVYLVSKRAVDLGGREKPIETGIKKQDAEAAIAELEEKYPKFSAIADDLQKYQDALLDFAKESGLIGEKGLENIKKLNKFYVPMFRVMETAGNGFMGGKKIAGNLGNPIKKIKGSEREVINPLESIIKNTYAIINAAERNNIGVMMSKLASSHFELGRLFEKVDKPMKPVSVSVKEVMAKLTSDMGIEFPENLQEDLGDTMVTLFRPAMDAGPNMLNVNMGDKSELYQVDPFLFRAIQGLNEEDLATVIKIFSYPAKLLRAGATLSPNFAARNPIRDQFSAMLFSQNNYRPGVDLAKGMFEVFKKGDLYDLWRMSGGEHSMEASMDRKNTQKKLNSLGRGKINNFFHSTPVDDLRAISEISEQATRLGEMGRALSYGKNPIQAAYDSREVTLDFARIGAKIKSVNSMIAFFNANIQGLDKFFRTGRKYPVRTLFKGILGLVLPTILLYYANRKDPRWKEIPQWEKDTYWIISVPGFPIIKIPKPFGLEGEFANVPENILQYIDTKDKTIFNDLEQSILSNAAPGFVPTGILPYLEAKANFNFFLQRPIVTPSEQSLVPAMQYGTYTSEIAKIIGDKLNYSPAKIDDLVYGYTGGLGHYATDAIDKVLEDTKIVNPPVAPKPGIEELPVLQAFMIPSPLGSNSESVNKVYNLSTSAAQDLASIKKLISQGDMVRARGFAAKHPDIANAALLSQVVATFSTITNARDKIRDSRDISAADKTTKIAKLDAIQTQIAEQILKQLK